MMELNITIFEHYSPSILAEHRDKLFVFGDNSKRIGLGGQANIRKEFNVVGIATKESPSIFMKDKNLAWNIALIELDIQTVLKIYDEGMYDFIVLPKGGLGTGLANLPEKAPQTYAYLKRRLMEVFRFDNDTGKLS